MGESCPMTGRQKTLADTNMYCRHMLPAPNMFHIQRIGCLVAPTEPRPIVPEAAWRLSLGQKVFAQGPLRMDAGWGRLGLKDGWTGYNPDLPSFLGDGVELAKEVKAEMRDGNLYIMSQIYFDVELIFASPFKPSREALDFWFVLVGLEARGVQ